MTDKETYVALDRLTQFCEETAALAMTHRAASKNEKTRDIYAGQISAYYYISAKIRHEREAFEKQDNEELAAWFKMQSEREKGK